MARGKIKRGREKFSKKFIKNKRKHFDKKRGLVVPHKRDSSHVKEDKSISAGRDKRRKVPEKILNLTNDEVTSEEEGEDHFKQLLTTFSNHYSNIKKRSMESDTSSEDEAGEKIKKSKLEENVSSDDSSVSNSENESTESCDEDSDDTVDPFICHFQYDLRDNMLETLVKLPQSVEKIRKQWPVLGQFITHLPKVENTDLVIKPKVTLEKEKQFASPGTVPQRITSANFIQMHIKSQIQNNISKANLKNLNENENIGCFTPLQLELFSVMKNYQDLYFPERNLKNGEEIRFIYCLHAVNHILKTRIRILNHNHKLQLKNDVPEEYRDQGLVRPKVVILVPFRESALRVVKMIMEILVPDEKANIMHKKRFFDEFTGNEIAMPRKNPRPEDYEQTFVGNTDDTFRVGISITKRSLRLYADFYSADIIVASPLGLRVIIGAEGELERDFDFLASVEMLVLDQGRYILHAVLNWDHMLHVFDHLHLQPQESHGTDFARVRTWALNGWTQYYRQTLVFSSVMLPEFNALFSKKCHNYAGKVTVVNPITTGSICQVLVQVPQ
ncbi:hypothetical protein L9F63_023765, partial [Diploptera punctata]